MGMITSDVIAGAFGLVDDLFTSDDEREAAKLKVMTLAQNGELQKMETAMSAIISESQSDDKWTSRARPAFLYVVYIYMLAAIPMGFVFAIDPVVAANITTGVGNWMNAIPEQIITLFGVGYLGYTGAREYGKHSKNKHSVT